MTLTPENKNYIGVSLMGLAIIVFWVFIMPAFNKISALNKESAERNEFLSSRVEILNKIGDLNKEYKKRSQEAAKISSVIPAAKGIAELVSTIEAISQQTGLQLVEITTGGSSNLPTGQAGQQQELQTISIELGLVGGYQSLVSFLDLIEKNIRLIDVFELSVSQSSTPGEQIVLNFRIKANAYYLNTK